MSQPQDPFTAICESLRLHELTRYTTDELRAELKRRETDVNSEESKETDDTQRIDGIFAH